MNGVSLRTEPRTALMSAGTETTDPLTSRIVVVCVGNVTRRVSVAMELEETRVLLVHKGGRFGTLP